MTSPTDANLEREARLRRFAHLEPIDGVASGKTASEVNAEIDGIRVFYGGRGIWYDAKRTASIAEPGVAVGLLHTGRHYPDDLTGDGIIYHYPSTQSPGKDVAEVQATKNAANLGIPVFVVTQAGSLREVHLGWVEDWDDAEERFLIRFSEKSEASTSGDDWEPISQRPTTRAEVNRRKRDPRFRFKVLKRYGNACAVCDLQVQGLIEAAHIIPVAEGGTSDPRNGVPLCPTHHAAFDRDLFTVNPHTHEIVTMGSTGLDDLRITRTGLAHLPVMPHADTLRWRWDRVVGE